MKKVISVLLAAMMIFTLFSCSGKNSGSSTSASPSAAATTDSATASASPSAVTEDVSAKADSIGFFTDGVDPKSRDTYNVYFTYPSTLLLFEKMTQSYNAFADKLNIKVTASTTEGDIDKYMTNFEVLAEQGADGFIVSFDPSVKERTKEILDELGLPYISLFNSIRDESGNSIVPTIGLDQYAAGATTLQWMFDNYKTYWGDIDTSTLGLLNFTYTTSSDLKDRGDGAVDLFKKLLPNNSNLIFECDGAASSDITATTGYNMSAAVFAAHPEVKYWFSVNCLEMYSQGTARAAEAQGIDKSVLIVDVGSDILCDEWANGYDGAWKACLAISNYLYAAPGICGLVAMMDGKATADILWTKYMKEGDKAAFYPTASQMVTKDTYKDYFNGIAKDAGMELPYK